MTITVANDDFGVMTAPTTLRMQRLLPGPVERVWAYLTASELRRKWFAAGDMAMAVDTPVELVWRNDELTVPPGQRPEGSLPESVNRRRNATPFAATVSNCNYAIICQMEGVLIGADHDPLTSVI